MAAAMAMAAMVVTMAMVATVVPSTAMARSVLIERLAERLEHSRSRLCSSHATLDQPSSQYR